MKNTRLIIAGIALSLVLVVGYSLRGGEKAGGVPTPGAVPTPGTTTPTPAPAPAPAPTTPGSPAPAPAPAPEPKPVAIKLGPLAVDATASFGTVTYKLGEMEGRSAGMQFPNYDFILIQVTVTNNGTTPFTVNSLNSMVLIDLEGKTQQVNAMAMAAKREKVDGVIDPGKSATGWIGFLTKLGDGNGKFKLVITPGELGEATYEFFAPLM